MLQSVNGCQIHYEILRNAGSDETPILLLHGWGCEADIFSGIMDALKSRATLITLDFPAHGQSEQPPEPWGVNEFMGQVKRLLVDLKIGKVNIIAHSFGARVAVYLAAKEPQMVEKVVVTGGAGVKNRPSPEASRRTERYKRLRAVTRFFMKVPLLKRPMKGMQERLIQKYGSRDYARLNESMRATFVKIIEEDLTPLFKDVVAPTLLIWGGADAETPLWMAETMEREMRDSGLVVFEGGSHYAFLEESTRFLTIVKQFFWGGQDG